MNSDRLRRHCEKNGASAVVKLFGAISPNGVKIYGDCFVAFSREICSPASRNHVEPEQTKN